jgi:hypothetical protein
VGIGAFGAGFNLWGGCGLWGATSLDFASANHLISQYLPYCRSTTTQCLKPMNTGYVSWGAVIPAQWGKSSWKRIW